MERVATRHRASEGASGPGLRRHIRRLRRGLGKSIMFNDISELRVSRIEMV